MSFFILQRGDEHGETLERFTSRVERHGFRKARDRRVAAHRLILYHDLSGGGVNYYENASGEFIAVLGSVIHKGRPPPDCLPELLSTFELASFSWQGLLGTHVIIVHKANALHVLGDGLGACRLYHDPTRRLWSNSFLALCELMPAQHFDVQACYEYVINGAVFGTRTLIEGIEALPANVVVTAADTVGTTALANPSGQNRAIVREPIETIADRHITQLDGIFEPIARSYGDRLRLSFSGGFDSRLMLAMLLRHEVKPALFVYGNEADEDVRIARHICAREGLELDCIDKRPAADDPETLAAETEQDLYAFDGWKVEQPLFDFGVDRTDRLRRHAGGGVPMNGSLGEIYRNFFYMPPGPSSTDKLISTFYSPYDPRAFTSCFDETRYRALLAAAMREAIGTTGNTLERWQVELLYPNFRGRYWTGRDAHINQRFGTMFFPYLEHAAIADTAHIPLHFKDLGRLQGRMIARVNPRLAAYPSDYGFALDGPRPLKYRLSTWMSTQRPAALRRLSFRLKLRQAQAREGALAAPVLSQTIDPELPLMRALFDPPNLYSARQYGLVANLEYLGQRFNLDIPTTR